MECTRPPVHPRATNGRAADLAAPLCFPSLLAWRLDGLEQRRLGAASFHVVSQLAGFVVARSSPPRPPFQPRHPDIADDREQQRDGARDAPGRPRPRMARARHVAIRVRVKAMRCIDGRVIAGARVCPVSRIYHPIGGRAGATRRVQCSSSRAFFTDDRPRRFLGLGARHGCVKANGAAMLANWSIGLVLGPVSSVTYFRGAMRLTPGDVRCRVQSRSYRAESSSFAV